MPGSNQTYFLLSLLFIAAAALFASAQTHRAILVISEPGASVRVDGVLYGKTDEKGRLTIATVRTGRHTLVVRADGFAEVTKPIKAAQRGDVAVILKKTDDAAELAFQRGERLSSTDRDGAVEAYRDAIAKRPKFSAAYLGLARARSGNSDSDGALKTLVALRKFSPRNAEASAIEGRIYRDIGNEKQAIAAFKRAITEGRGFQPEAYAGLGLLYKDRAENASGNDAEVAADTAEAIKALSASIKQLSGAPDAIVIYQLLGLIYEQQKQYKQAIALYEEFLRIFPDAAEAEAVRSFIVQIKKQTGLRTQ